MTSYKDMAIKAYANDDENKRYKAVSAGTAIDNALKLNYGLGGTTRCHFMMDNYLKYFSYEALGHRNKLL